MNCMRSIDEDFSFSENGRLNYYSTFIPTEESALWYERLLTNVLWEEEFIVLFGQSKKVPRLIAFYGDEAVTYRYSNRQHRAQPWLPMLLELKQRVEAVVGENFNAVLCNYYRDGMDSMGWHADNEPELGEDPLKASCTFGAARRFKIRHNFTKEQYNYELRSGSLLVMSGEFQQYWQHSIPRSRKVHDGRINLTFRQIHLPASKVFIGRGRDTTE